MTKYICFEGVEGSYKTTNVTAVAQYLNDQGKSVLVTKEPGTHHLPLTMKLREIMLSNEYASSMTPIAREFISQAIRSIHIEKLVNPQLKAESFDYVIQDRGTLSGLAYAVTLGHDPEKILRLIEMVSTVEHGWNIYDQVILLSNDPVKGLDLAVTKQEFEGGDVMESQGPEFMARVLDFMKRSSQQCSNVSVIDVENKRREEVLNSILNVLI